MTRRNVSRSCATDVMYLRTRQRWSPAHKDVRDALANANIPFSICYPERSCKEEYLQRYRDRGSPEAFIKLLDTQWDNWITEMEEERIEHLALLDKQYRERFNRLTPEQKRKRMELIGVLAGLGLNIKVF